MKQYEFGGKIISVAAELVTGKCLMEIYEVCYSQKQVSTSRLLKLVDNAQEKMKIYTSTLREGLRKIESDGTCTMYEAFKEDFKKGPGEQMEMELNVLGGKIE